MADWRPASLPNPSLLFRLPLPHIFRNFSSNHPKSQSPRTPVVPLPWFRNLPRIPRLADPALSLAMPSCVPISHQQVCNLRFKIIGSDPSKVRDCLGICQKSPIQAAILSSAEASMIKHRLALGPCRMATLVALFQKADRLCHVPASMTLSSLCLSQATSVCDALVYK